MCNQTTPLPHQAEPLSRLPVLDGSGAWWTLPHSAKSLDCIPQCTESLLRHICIFAIPSSWMGVPNKVARIVCDRKFCPKDLVSPTEAANKPNEGALKWQVKTSESIHCIIQELVDPHTDQLRLWISSGRCWLEKSFWCEEMVASNDYVNKSLSVKTINHLLHSF